jgi:hypothetical protein
MSFDGAVINSASQFAGIGGFQRVIGILSFASIRDMHPCRELLKDAFFAADKSD